MEDNTANLAMFLIAQSIVILGAIVGTYVKIKVALATLDTEAKTDRKAATEGLTRVEKNTNELRNDHRQLSGQVGGISRAVARLEGAANISPSAEAG